MGGGGGSHCRGHEIKKVSKSGLLAICQAIQGFRDPSGSSTTFFSSNNSMRLLSLESNGLSTPENCLKHTALGVK
jgi:hypothetical protein